MFTKLQQGMGQRMAQVMVQVCRVCERHRDEEQAASDTAEVALLGLADPYAVCPGCRQIVHDPSLLTDPEYRRKVRVKLFEDTGKVMKVQEWEPRC